MKKVLIFDFGGTIVTDDSDDRLHLMFYNEFIRKFNLPVSAEEMYDYLKAEIKEVLKRGHEKWENLSEAYTQGIKKLLEAKRLEAKEEYLSIFKKLYLEYHEAYTEPFPHAIETLIKLKSAGFRLAIISNIDNEIIEPVLRRLGIFDIFELIVTSEELGYGKPNRKIFETTLRRLNVLPNDTIYVGDSLINDVQGAREAGMEAIHFGVDCKNWKELYKEIINRGIERCQQS